ncbi:MAG: P-loop NTPase [Microthrixaceae bacterium]
MSPPSAPEAPTVEEVKAMLAHVIDPELGADIVELGMVRDVVVAPLEELPQRVPRIVLDRSEVGPDRAKGGTEGGVGVVVTMALTTAGCPLRAQLRRDTIERVTSLPGVGEVRISWAEMTQDEKADAMAIARRRAADRAPSDLLPDRTRAILVASGKGGVGKSSVTANLAVALAARGLTVGLIDADIWGFSIPRMLGIDGRLEAAEAEGKINPHRLVVGDGAIEVVSMGFLVEDESVALMWRGLMLQRAVQHFLEDVAWADLDYLLVDLPPGTGDVQMGLARLLPRAEMLVVTTPSLAASRVARRAVSMARNNYLRVIGVVENLSHYEAPDGSMHHIFGAGGGEYLAHEAGVPLLGAIPIQADVAIGGDEGSPVALGLDGKHPPPGPAAQAFGELAETLATEVSPPVTPLGCTARTPGVVEVSLPSAGAPVG